MKTRLIVVLIGLFSFFGSTAVLAHSTVYGGVYTGIPLTGGIAVWGDSYGQSGYAGNVSLGFSSRHGGYGYVSFPLNRHISRHGYGYPRSYRHYRGHGHGSGYRHHNRHHYRNRHGRHH